MRLIVLSKRNMVGGFAWTLACTLCVVSGCRQEPASKISGPAPSEFAPVTVVITGLEPEIEKVDIVVNGSGIDPVYGTFLADSTDRVVMNVPFGDSLVAFARAFEVDTIISYIGENYFDVRSRQPQEVFVPLKYKGPHLPTF